MPPRLAGRVRGLRFSARPTRLPDGYGREHLCRRSQANYKLRVKRLPEPSVCLQAGRLSLCRNVSAQMWGGECVPSLLKEELAPGGRLGPHCSLPPGPGEDSAGPGATPPPPLPRLHGLSSVSPSLCVTCLGVEVSALTPLGSFQPFSLLQPSTPVLPPEPQGHEAVAPEALLVSGLSGCSQGHRPASRPRRASALLWAGSVACAGLGGQFPSGSALYFLFPGGRVSSSSVLPAPAAP